MCDSFQPVPVQDDLSYGFAYQVSDTQQGTDPNCCKCYEVSCSATRIKKGRGIKY